mmetsp:Transcript_14368/g.23719  ORF Transcript_14368/g.23719 Transcript_14368/m.23719 type:complete len:100 (-) Transcript_14368:631-930(-)
MSEAQVSAALSLLKRLWPSKETLGLIIDLVPDVSEKLLTQIEQPLQVQVDATGKEFILCEYARDGDSFSGRVLGLPGQTSTTLPWKTEPFHLRGCEQWR